MTFLRPGHGNIPHPSPYGCRPCPPERGERHHEKLSTARLNLAALFVFLANDVVLLSLGLVAGLFNMAGNYFGARYFAKRGSQNVKPVIIIVLTVFSSRSSMNYFSVKYPALFV